MAELNQEQDKVPEQEQEQEQEQDCLVGVRGLVGRNYGKNNITHHLYLFLLKEDLTTCRVQPF